jgi:hypothetical protein
MNRGYLSNYFRGVGAKRLSAVEADPSKSNQHEFNGVASLKSIFGLTERREVSTRFIYLGDTKDDFLSETGKLSWYDSRRKHATRTEWRLYFSTTAVSDEMSEGDLVIFGDRTDDTIIVIVAAAGSTYESQLLWLFGLHRDLGDMQIAKPENGSDRELNYAARTILSELGIELEETDEDYLDIMLDRFGGGFPTTREFSSFARETLTDVDPVADPDAAVLAWLDQEEILFRTLERHFVEQKLEDGFGGDVDQFISYSLSVQNRRKSRAGHAFENQLEQVFEAHDVLYDRGAKTEGRSKPDFLFPGAQYYHDESFPVDRLTMLGAKSTCKDRWRQVLAEATRIDQKHLITLEAGISENQTDEMQNQSLQLVLPEELQDTYTGAQQSWLMPLDDFIDLIETHQPGLSLFS